MLAPGQGPLKGKVFRIGHFGYFSELDIIRGLAALEMTLERLGYPVKRGAAVAAAEGVFSEPRASRAVRVLVTEKLSEAGPRAAPARTSRSTSAPSSRPAAWPRRSARTTR